MFSRIISDKKLKWEWSDCLLSDFKNILTAWKWGQVMNKAANKKCIAQLGHKLWSLKQLIFNKDWCDLYALHIIKYAYIETTAIKSLNKSL